MNAATLVDHPAATLVADLATSVAGVLPSLSGWRIEPVPTSAPADVLPPNASAVGAHFDGIGRVALMAAAPLATGVPAADPAGEAPLAQALRSAAAGLGLDAVGAVAIGADTFLAGPGEVLVAVRLLDGDSHMATVALLVGDASAPPAAAPLPSGTSSSLALASPLELLHDVEMAVTVELGRTRMLLRDVLALGAGSVIELDRAAGSPVDLFVNGTLIARGEVVVVDEEFGVRITEVVRAGDAARGR